jgi:hypothetical protein
MAEQTDKITVYVPVIIYGRDKYEYDATTCGVFRNKKDALKALIRELVTGAWICNEFSFDSENPFSYEGVELKKDDTEYNIQVLCKHTNTVEDVENMCAMLGDSFYEDGWKIEVNEFQLQ